jgi:predicted Zn finger-like uncharacterized protein
MFRVVADQLKISEGWVRCGHCGEVFDASAHLSDESILEMPPLAEQATRPAELPTRAPDLPTQPDDLESLPAQDESQPAPAAAPPPAKAAAADAAAAEEGEGSSFFGSDSQSLEPSPLDAPFVFRPSDLVRSTGDSSILPEPEPGREYQYTPPRRLEEEEEDGPALADVSFVQQARRKALWRRPSVRIGLSFLGLALAALLVLQVAYRDRDRLALAQPSLRPALETLCEALDCTLGAPRQIESIVIESSGFNRLRNDTYRLAFTLRNTAAVQVAAPAMELTITDAQDQPIARRVILPAEIGPAQDAIAAGSDVSRVLGVAISPPAGAQVAGYRLLAFYP